MAKKNIGIPKKSEHIDLSKLDSYLDSLNLNKAEHLNFWLYCKIAKCTALRARDILNMKVSAIDFENESVRVTEQKTGREVKAGLNSQLLERIDRSREYVLWNEKYSSKVSLMTINRRLKDIYKGDDVQVSSHSLRKSVARAVYKNYGNDIVQAMKFLGHKDTRTTYNYLEIREDELRDIYEFTKGL